MITDSGVDVGNVVEWLKRRPYDQTGLGSNPLAQVLEMITDSGVDVGNVVEWLKRRPYDQTGLGSNPLAPFCCVLRKDTIRHFSVIGGLGKQF